MFQSLTPILTLPLILIRDNMYVVIPYTNHNCNIFLILTLILTQTLKPNKKQDYSPNSKPNLNHNCDINLNHYPTTNPNYECK